MADILIILFLCAYYGSGIATGFYYEAKGKRESPKFYEADTWPDVLVRWVFWLLFWPITWNMIRYVHREESL